MPAMAGTKSSFNFFDGLESYRRERYKRQGTDKTIQLIKDFAAAETGQFPEPQNAVLIQAGGAG